MDRLSRKTISDAFYQHEIEAELRERRLSWSFHGNEEESLKSVLLKFNELRSSEIYPHSDDDCSVSCDLKGILVPGTNSVLCHLHKQHKNITSFARNLDIFCIRCLCCTKTE